MRWRQGTKIKALIERYGWQGDNADFMEHLAYLIGRVPEPYQTILRRHYIEDDSQRHDPEAGKAVGKERYYYQHLQTGKAVLDGMFALSASDCDKLAQLKRRGVC
jgi:hypothetical protein